MTRSRHAEKCDLPTKSIKIGTLKPLRFKGSSGAAGRIRTADLILTKDALYLLSYSSICAAYAAFYSKRLAPFHTMATQNGLEPSTSSVTGWRSNQLNYWAKWRSKTELYENSRRCFTRWQGQKDSNPRHAVLETAALPAELYPYMVGLRGLEPGTGRL